jgi:ornithine cyclodeaminase
MKLRIVPAAAMLRIASRLDLRGILREAMVAVSRGEVEMPLRWALALPQSRGMLGMMPGWYGPADAAGIKLISLVPPALREGRSSHLGLMILYDGAGLVPRALLCGATLTSLRTAAATAVATDVLARSDARVLAVLGTGEQAESHLEALAPVRDFAEVRIWGRRQPSAQALAERQAGRFADIRVCATVAAALAGADVVCAVTSSPAPVFGGESLEPGMHVNLVGSSTPDKRECDTAAVCRSRFIVDYRPSAMAQAGELLTAIREGAVTEQHIAAEIGEVIAGTAAGRTSAAEITLYKSLGVAAQDLAVAAAIVDAATAAGEGSLAEL